ncbi:MAG: PP2C family protein-serine/threonine phosphatase [Geminicoccaceae bacterium]
MAEPEIFEHTLGLPLICLVADGMSGHAAGEVASRSVAEHLARRAVEATDEAAMAQLLLEANDELFALMDRRPAWYGMGTTVAGVAVAPSGEVGFNVGDSRVYRIEARALVQLSTDDTPGPKLPDGRTAVHTSSIISQVLGGYGPDQPGEQVVPHVLSEPLSDRARYLICSDGLTDLLERAAIEALLDDDDQASATALFEAAMARGGDDNVSLILLRLRRGA